MNEFDALVINHLAALRAILVIVPIHAEVEPVERYSRLISEKTGVPHGVAELPKDARTYSCGYRFICIPEVARADFCFSSRPPKTKRKKSA